MARRPRKTTKEVSKLEKAISFAKSAQTDKPGEVPTYVFCRIYQKQVVAHNGILTYGHPIDEDLSVCPHTYSLDAALKRCKSAVSLVYDETRDVLTINSGRLNMDVGCVNPASIPMFYPDPQQGPITDEIISGLKALGPIIGATDELVMQTSVMLRNMSMIATDGKICVEYWHGVRLPDQGVLLPKQFVSAVMRHKGAPVGIGFSDRTCTIHYETGEWIKTQLYDARYPDVDTLLAFKTNPFKFHPELFEAVETVMTGSPLGKVSMCGDKVVSANTDKEWKYALEGVPDGITVDGKHFGMLKDYVNSMDYQSSDRAIYLYGDKVRAVIVKAN